MKSVVTALTLSVCVGCSTTPTERSCRFDVDCKTYDRCLEGYCESGVCRIRDKPDQVLPDDHAGDCLRPACESGSVTLTPDNTDKPDDLRDCRIPDCKSLYNYRPRTVRRPPPTGVCKGSRRVPAEVSSIGGQLCRERRGHQPGLALVDLHQRRLPPEPRGAVHLRDAHLLPGARRPVDLDLVRADLRRVEVSARAVSVHRLARLEPHVAEIDVGSRRRFDAELLRELPARRAEMILVGFDEPLRQAPRAVVLLRPERAAGVHEQDLARLAIAAHERHRCRGLGHAGERTRGVRARKACSEHAQLRRDPEQHAEPIAGCEEAAEADQAEVAPLGGAREAQRGCEWCGSSVRKR